MKQIDEQPISRGIKTLFKLWIMLCVTIPVVAFAEDYRLLSGKYLNFFLHTGSGNFYLENPSPKNEKLKYFLFKDRPPTSYVTLIMNGKPYRLSASELKINRWFSNDMGRLYAQMQIEDVEFILSFTLTNSSPEKANDSILCLLEVKNRSKKKVDVGGRFMFDTFYDERWGKPFLYMSSGENVVYETILRKENMTEFVFSGVFEEDGAKFGDGLYIFPYINALRPSQLILGNWKKLDENEIGYRVVPKQAFKYNSFANKDGAVAVIYENIYIKPGEVVKFGTLLTRTRVSASTFDYTAVAEIPTNTNVLPQATNIVAVKNTNVAATNALTTNEVVKDTNTVVNTNVTVISSNTGSMSAKVDAKDYKPGYYTNTGGMDPALLKAQIELMDRMTGLIEKMDKKLDKLITADVNHVTTNTVVVRAESNTNAVVAATNTGKSEVEKKMDIDYKNKMEKQQKYYEDLLKNQEKKIEETVISYEKRLENESFKTAKSADIKNLDRVIQSLDEQIKIIQELEKLKLDFSSLPAERVEELNKVVERLEKVLIGK